LAPEALTNARGFNWTAAAFAVIATALSLAPLMARAAQGVDPRHYTTRSGYQTRRHLPYPMLALPLQISGSQYEPVAFSDIAGWNEDDHLQAYQAFRLSCKQIAAQPEPSSVDPRALGISLREPCLAAKATDISTSAKAKDFFETYFLPLRISRLGEDEGFVTGYYEPVIDGSRTRTDVYTVPVYRRPSNLFVRGYKQSDVGLPNKG